MNAEIKERIEMINRGEVPEGYKKTRVGIIPEDWEVKSLGEVAEVLRGASPRPISDPKWFDEDSSIGWVRISDVSNSNKILKETEQYLSNEGIKKSRFVKKSNIIMSICATVGKPIYTGIDVCIHDGFVVFKKLSIDKEFFYYVLLKKEKAWYKYGQTGSQMNLNTSIVEKERICIPLEIKEQQKIAQILSTWGEAIELKEKLIEEKEKQKKGLMQKLLTGEARLPGFDGEWEEVRLGDVSDIRTGDKNNENKVENGKYPFFVRSEKIERIDSYSYDGEAILIPGDGKIGEIYHYINGKFDYHQRVYKISDFINEVHGKYVYYYLKQFFKRQAMKYTAKATVDSLRLPMLIEMPLFIPKSFQEQKAIAQILSTADKEIELLEEELELLKLQKKGLMQLLLKGIIRVKC